MFATVPSVIKTLLVVAPVVTLAVIVLDGTVFGVKAFFIEVGDPEGAVPSVILTFSSVTLLLTDSVLGFRSTAIYLTDVNNGGGLRTSCVGRIISLTVQTNIVPRTYAFIFSHSVATAASVSTWVVGLVALIQDVLITDAPSHPRWTDTLELVLSHWMAHSFIQTGPTATSRDLCLTQVTTVRLHTGTDWLGIPTCALATILTGLTCTEVDLFAAVMTSVPGVAFTAVVVDHLDTAVGAQRITGVGQTLIDISLTARTHITWLAVTFVSIYLFYTGAPMETGTSKAVLFIKFTQQALRSW